MGSMRLNDVVAEIVGDVIAGRAINKRQAATARWHDIDADGQYLAGIDGVVTRIDHRARALRVKAERGNALCQAELPFQLPAAVGKGYAEALTVWREYLDKLNALRDRKGIIAARWSMTLGVQITPAQVALCMIDVKLARLAHDPAHADSAIDVAGYAALLREVCP